MDCMRLFTKEDVLDGDEKPVSHPSGTAVSKRPSRQMRSPADTAWSPWIRTALSSSVCRVFQTCCRCRARKRCIKKFSIQRFPKILVLRILAIH